MNVLYAACLFVAAVALVVLAAIAWRRRHVEAIRELCLFCLSVALLVASHGLELTQERIEVLRVVVRFEWCFGAYPSYFWLLFSLAWCGRGPLATRGVRAGLLAVPTLTALFALTNDHHGLVYSAMWVDTSGSFPVLAVTNGPWYWVHFAWSTTCILAGNVLFVRQFRNVRPLHRRQARIMMLASFLPWVTDLGFSLGIGNGVYITAFGLSVSAMLFAWAIFRLDLLDVTPVARYELVELMRDPVLAFDDAGRLLDHNRAACQLLCEGGAHGSEITRADIVRRAPELAKALEGVDRGEGSTFRHAGRSFSLSATVLSPAVDRRLTLCVLHDVTEQSRAEERLLQLNATLEERVAREVAKNRAKDEVLARQSRIAAMGEMVGAIGHQWRQPLAILSIIVQDFHAAAEKKGAPTRTEWKEFKADALGQIGYMSRTIEEFRSFLRPDQRHERFPVGPCLEEALRLCSAQFKEHRIVQELHLPRGPSHFGFGAPGQLTQVLLNLLSNAREAIAESRSLGGGKPVQGRVVLSLADREDRILITVCDNGCGIPEERRDRIFDPYFTTRADDGGSGLGLYIARTLVESGFGGTIRHDALPEGTCFTLELPVAVEEHS